MVNKHRNRYKTLYNVNEQKLQEGKEFETALAGTKGTVGFVCVR